MKEKDRVKEARMRIRNLETDTQVDYYPALS